MSWSTTDDGTQALKYIHDIENVTSFESADENGGADDSSSALLYIVCVLCFYAFSIVVLMIKYVRREKEEADQRNFFNEFIQRERFNSPQYQNQFMMQKLLTTIKMGCSPYNNMKLNCDRQSPEPGQSGDSMIDSATCSIYELAQGEEHANV